jgi:nitroreductase
MGAIRISLDFYHQLFKLEKKTTTATRPTMQINELVHTRRSIRRFRQESIPIEILRDIVDAARVAPSASNLQPLRYLLIYNKSLVERIFPHTKWAAYLPADSGRPPAGQEPTAYVIILIDEEIATQWVGHDVGAAAENMILTALDNGIGSCWIASLNRPELKQVLVVPAAYRIDSALALGYPDEAPVIEVLQHSVEYYRDEEGCFHVPKRSLGDILFENSF